MKCVYVVFSPRHEKTPEALFERVDGAQIRELLKSDKREIFGFCEVRSAAMRQAKSLLIARDTMLAALKVKNAEPMPEIEEAPSGL